MSSATTLKLRTMNNREEVMSPYESDNPPLTICHLTIVVIVVAQYLRGDKTITKMKFY